MKEPKYLFLPHISFSLPISSFWPPLFLYPLSFPTSSFLPFVQIQWEWGNISSLALLVTAWRLEELFGTGPLSRWGPGAFFVCGGVICQAVVAEVEPLRLKGYDPRSAVCVCFLCECMCGVLETRPGLRP